MFKPVSNKVAFPKMEEEVHSGEQVQCRSGFRYPDESPDMGGFGSRWRLLRSSDGLQGL